MDNIKYFVLIVLLIGSCNLYAGESKVILGLEVGSSSLDLDTGLSADFDSNQFDVGESSGTLLAGYRWQNNVQIEANYSRSGSGFLKLGLGDSYQATEGKLLVGYSFELTKYLRIIPLLGVSRWDLALQEIDFLNLDSQENIDLDGADFSYKVNVEFPISKRFVLGVSYASTNIDVGSINLTQVSFKYEF